MQGSVRALAARSKNTIHREREREQTIIQNKHL